MISKENIELIFTLKKLLNLLIVMKERNVGDLVGLSFVTPTCMHLIIKRNKIRRINFDLDLGCR